LFFTMHCNACHNALQRLRCGQFVTVETALLRARSRVSPGSHVCTLRHLESTRNVRFTPTIAQSFVPANTDPGFAKGPVRCMVSNGNEPARFLFTSFLRGIL